MALYGAVGDAPLTRTSGRRGVHQVHRSIALDGGNPTPVPHPFRSVLAVSASMRRNTALSSGTAFVTTEISANVVNLYGWVLAGTASAGTELVDVLITGVM